MTTTDVDTITEELRAAFTADDEGDPLPIWDDVARAALERTRELGT